MPNSGPGKLFKLAGASLGIAMIVIGIFVTERLARFQAGISRLRSNGDPVSVADLTWNAPDADQDAVVWLRRAVPLVEQFTHHLKTEEFVPFELSYGGFYQFHEDEATFDKFNELVAKYADIFEYLEKAADCHDATVHFTGFRNQADEYGLYDIPLDDITRIVALRMKALAASNQPDQAVELGIRMLQIARLLDQRPTSVVWRFMKLLFLRQSVVTVTYNITCHLEIAPATRERLNRELEMHGSMAGYVQGLRGERAWIIEKINGMPIQKMVLNGVPCLAYFENAIAIAQQPVIDIDGMRQEYGIPDGGLLMSLSESWFSVLEIEYALVSRIRAMRIISALQSDPQSAEQTLFDRDYLESIGVPGEMTVDLVSGETMKVRWQHGKWCVYSVGTNRVDDQGGETSQLDHGLGRIVMEEPG